MKVLPRSWAERLGAWLETRELPVYFHLPGYMRRWWVFGARSWARNLFYKMPALPETWFERLYQIATQLVCVRLHEILRSDSDRALHDHPAVSASLILRGGYWEVTPRPAGDFSLGWRRYAQLLAELPDLHPDYTSPERTEPFGVFWRGSGTLVVRGATAPHRIILPRGQTSLSLFVLFKRSNHWGFYPQLDGVLGDGSWEKIPHEQYESAPISSTTTS